MYSICSLICRTGRYPVEQLACESHSGSAIEARHGERKRCRMAGREPTGHCSRQSACQQRCNGSRSGCEHAGIEAGDGLQAAGDLSAESLPQCAATGARRKDAGNAPAERRSGSADPEVDQRLLPEEGAAARHGSPTAGLLSNAVAEVSMSPLTKRFGGESGVSIPHCS